MKISNISLAPNRQEGAALIVSIAIIFVISILSVSSMRESTLEGQLAANAFQKEITFQSAESASDIVLAIEDSSQSMAVESFICKDDEKFLMDDLSVPDVQNTSVTVGYAGQALVTGWSLGGPVGGRRFVVTGKSELPGANTTTQISQGIIAIGASQQGHEC